MHIFIISPGFHYQNSRALLTPLLLWGNNLKKYDYNIQIRSKILDGYEGDIIAIDSKLYRNEWLYNENKILKNFKKLKKKFNKVVYIDTADSSGWIQSQLLPIVDKYWKFQVLKNKKLYLKPHYDKRIYTDYYSTKNNITDDNKYFSSKISNIEDLKKINVFWNSSMANYSKYSHILSLIYKKTKIKHFLKYRFREINNFDVKKNNIFCRFNYLNYRKTISFHRRQIKDKLSYYDNLVFSKINRTKYFDELKKSKLSISPFGWGEIAYRDFESFINKTILIKPSMDHLVTWPNLYIDKKTYFSFNWNFNNLIDVIENVLDNYNAYKDIAEEGYYNYFKYTGSNNSSTLFEKRFDSLIQDII